MQYETKQLHVLNQLHDDPEISKRFAVPPDLRNMSIAILIVLGMGLAAGILFKVDQIVPAQGLLETQQKLFEIRATEAGFVKTVIVKEGDIVSKGDVLMSLDTEQTDLQIAAIKSQQELAARAIWTDFHQIADHIDAKLKVRLLEKIIFIEDQISRVGYDTILSKTLTNELNVIQKSIAELAIRTSRDAAQLRIATQSFNLSKAAFERQTSLLSKKLGKKADHESSEKLLLEARDRTEQLKSSLLSTDAEKNRLEAEKQKLNNQFVSERLLRIHNGVDEFNRLQFEKTGLERRLSELELRSPFDGIVDELNILGNHEVVEAGKALASIRPHYDLKSLTIDMLVPSNYAIWVQEGMPFRASSQGNSPEDHGYIVGKVGYISKSTEELNGARLYRIRGIIDEFDFTDRLVRTEATETLIRPGLQLSVEIKVGQRRLINYILDPFSDGFRRALTEPS